MKKLKPKLDKKKLDELATEAILQIKRDFMKRVKIATTITSSDLIKRLK